jgi:uncharacterized phage-associated protein
MNSCHSISATFNKLAHDGGEELSSVRLQSLVCLAQFYSLGITGKKLFKENVRANRDGPEIKELKFGQEQSLRKLPEPFLTLWKIF